MKTVFEYIGAAVIGGAFVFMIVWAAFQTDPQYRHSYLIGDMGKRSHAGTTQVICNVELQEAVGF